MRHNFLEVALNCIAQNFKVHPLKPGSKEPLTYHGKNDASGDEAQIRAWWAKWPDANVGIACGPSGLCVLDCDHGLADETAFYQWRTAAGLPETYTVRTGRRPEFGVQMYFSDPIPDVSVWKLNGCEGQIKSLGGYVCAAGDLHPSGETYQVLCDAPIAPTPDGVRQLRSVTPEQGKDAAPVEGGRNNYLTSVAGKLRNAGLGRDALEAALLQHNADNCIPPLPDDEVKQIAVHVARYDTPEPVGEVVIGEPAAPPEPVDWRTHYHTLDEMGNAPPPTFLIDDFLIRDSITALAAPVGQRKSLVALNVAHALCTNAPLFDHFKVVSQPTRVLYLCPEMGLRSFTYRVRKIGLLPYVGKTLFCRTMSAPGFLELSEFTTEELAGAVVILDTAVRYLKGDENSSEDMRVFAENVFRLMRDGAAAVLVLHHSAKGTKESSELTLENAMRGSGELGAFVSSCWATRLQNPAEPYQSASYLTNVKQREFQSKAFEVTSGEDCRLHIVGDPATRVATLTPHRGNKGNRDGMDDAAEAVIRAHVKMPIRKLQEHLATLGIERGTTWVAKTRARIQVGMGEVVLAG